VGKKNKYNSKEAFTVGRRHSVGIRPDMAAKVIRPKGMHPEGLRRSVVRFFFCVRSEIRI
jgi:hypothetical protein